MRFRLLGTLQVSVGDDGGLAALGGYRQRLVFALLLLHAGESVPVERLIDQVWGDRPPPTARKTLQVYISRLRNALGNGDIVAGRSGYTLQAEPEEVDAAVFARMAAEGRRLLDGDPAAAAEVLGEALSLWRGTPWGELADEPALSADADRLRQLRLAVVEDRLAADLALGRDGSPVGELRALVTEHPLRERLRGLLMVALYRQGQTADALRVYQDGRALLADELGADPGPYLQATHQRILQQDPSLVVKPLRGDVMTDDTPMHNPYKGMSPFGEGDAEDFFGRDGLVQELVGRLAASSFVVVVGPSGSGKSSVVRAGLLPALRDGGVAGSSTWQIAAMFPGAHPFAQLEATLLRAVADPAPGSLSPQFRGDDLDLLRAVLRVVPDEDGRLVLVIDQFEELFLQVVDDEERDRFFRNLAEAAEDPHSRLTIVAVIRADLLDRPMAHPRLGPMVVDGLVHVLPLTPAELETACVEPAARVGVRVEPELAAELVAEVADRPGALPLFQYTLTELFDRRREHVITLSDYRALDGIQGVVARRAEDTFASLDEAVRPVCRQVFLRLVTIGDEGDVGRRRAFRAELNSLIDDVEVIDVVVKRFAAARLVAIGRDASSGQATVELAHEALLRAWPRLRGWIDESRDDLRVQRWVSAAAHDWRVAGGDEGYVLSGTRLDVAAEWRNRPSAAPTAAEREFVDASVAKRQRDWEREQARQARELRLERRAAGRLRQLVTVLAIATVVAGALGATAMVQRSRAEEQAAAAQATTELMRARQLASTAVATRRVDPELSLLLALHAVNITSQAEIPVPDEIVEALHWALQAARVQFPGDADQAVVAGPEGPQGVFHLAIADLVELARANVGRELTPRECAQYLELETCPQLPSVLALGQTSGPQWSPSAGALPLEGTRVSVVTTISPNHVAGAVAEFEAFRALTGIEIDLSTPGTPDLIASALEDGRPPDIAIVAQPTLIPDYARNGDLIDLAGYLDAEQLQASMSEHLVALGSMSRDGTWPAEDGAVYGLPAKVTVKSTVWYSIPAFEEGGYEIPSTYDELLALTERIAADGLTPWCHGEGAADASGWPGTDVIENLLLHDSKEDYDAWLKHEIGFDSPPLHDAFDRMADLLLEPGHVFGGHSGAATLEQGTAMLPMFQEPPGCLMYPSGIGALGMLPFGIEPGRDVGVFPFPPVNPEQGPVVLGAGDYAMTFTDRPEVRETVRFLAGKDYGKRWAAVDPWFMSPHSDFPQGAYVVNCSDGACQPDTVRGALAPTLAEALQNDRFRFDGSDLLPDGMGFEPMWAAMVEFVGSGPGSQDEILAELEATWDERERDARS